MLALESRQIATQFLFALQRRHGIERTDDRRLVHDAALRDACFVLLLGGADRLPLGVGQASPE